MIPAIGLVQIGRKRWVPLPLPLFLLWPLLLVGWLLLEGVRLLVPRGSAAALSLEAARLGFLTLFHLSGLRVDVQSADGAKVRFRLY
jgi:hypothetical protein